jgi:hypothetical protein
MKNAIANNLIKIINKPFASAAAENLPHQSTNRNYNPYNLYLSFSEILQNFPSNKVLDAAIGIHRKRLTKRQNGCK